MRRLHEACMVGGDGLANWPQASHFLFLQIEKKGPFLPCFTDLTICGLERERAFEDETNGASVQLKSASRCASTANDVSL